MFVVVGGSLRVLLLRVRAGAFVRACLTLTLIWTVDSHFTFFPLILSLSFHFFVFSSLLCVCQEFEVTFMVPIVR